MSKSLFIALLIPLMLVASISAKALDNNETHSLLKAGILETSYEVNNCEITPDLDQAILPAAQLNFSEAPKNQVFLNVSSQLQDISYFLSCRDPPKA